MILYHEAGLDEKMKRVDVIQLGFPSLSQKTLSHWKTLLNAMFFLPDNCTARYYSAKAMANGCFPYVVHALKICNKNSAAIHMTNAHSVEPG